MRIDALLVSSGLLADAEVDARALESVAYRFLSSGGCVSLTEWAALSDESRAALAAAGDRMRREQAQRAVTEWAASMEEMTRRAATDAAEMLVDKVGHER